jgi:hypothetical protein
MDFQKRAIRKTRFLWAYFRSFVFGWLNRKDYRNVRSFLIFVGYPRSGHSLIAALLDAHPNVLIGMEWGVLTHLKLGFGRRQIYYSIQRISRLFTQKLGNVWTGYSYRVEGQYQGRSDKLLVLGDKLAGQTSLLLREEPLLLDRLCQEMGEVKILHVIRNPFDTISTMLKRSREKSESPMKDATIREFCDRYFERVEVIAALKKKGKYDILDVWHEDFLEDPEGELRSILDFIGLTSTGQYLADCARIVYPSPHQSRFDLEWEEDLKSWVQNRMNAFDFLQRYRFENPAPTD